MIATTTLAKIRSHSPCESGWRKLLRGLGKSGLDDEALSLERILEINGLDDALWALRSVDGIEKAARLFACDCAQRVAHLNPDPRVQAAIDTARRFARGEANREELQAAQYAAYAASDAASDAAWAAARAAAWAAARAAASDAAGAVAWAAARAAARAAASDAASDAAGAVERKIQAELFIQHFCRE